MTDDGNGGRRRRCHRAHRDQKDAILAVLRAHATESGFVAWGCRRIAEATNLGKDTVSRRLQELVVEGVLERRPGENSSHGHADTYKLRDPYQANSGLTGTGVWTHERKGQGGLGPRAEKVWNTLDVEQPKLVAQLATALNLTPAQVRAELHKLMSAGCANTIDNAGRAKAWVRLQPADDALKRLASHLQVEEVMKWKQRQHAYQRAQWVPVASALDGAKADAYERTNVRSA